MRFGATSLVSIWNKNKVIQCYTFLSLIFNTNFISSCLPCAMIFLRQALPTSHSEWVRVIWGMYIVPLYREWRERERERIHTLIHTMILPPYFLTSLSSPKLKSKQELPTWPYKSQTKDLKNFNWNDSHSTFHSLPSNQWKENKKQKKKALRRKWSTIN